jgi:hypothetical protein
MAAAIGARQKYHQMRRLRIRSTFLHIRPSLATIHGLMDRPLV